MKNSWNGNGKGWAKENAVFKLFRDLRDRHWGLMGRVRPAAGHASGAGDTVVEMPAAGGFRAYRTGHCFRWRLETRNSRHDHEDGGYGCKLS
jgi:hypothetical protein